ncbi:unnamed protein product [Leptosia nina]|uniref:Uncharacterized protein n=1 Tax=Leptosia nina TaxID=320188 RepID=A0AAV1IYD8_9NEOP
MSETSADPHDSTRGFFFAHFGWLMMKKHPHVIEEGKKVDMSDITGDPILSFYNKHFMFFKIFCCFYLPTMVPVWFYGEELYIAFLATLLRFLYSTNITSSVNSFAHLYGMRPYNKHISPVQNIGVSILAYGEGWHNYHHAFPWDYKSAELPYFINFSTLFLDVAAYLGLAYDLKTASPSLIDAVAQRMGDNSRKHRKKEI